MSSHRAALIVDANPEVTELVSKIFPSMEWTVTNAPTNKAALLAVQARRFDIVLTSEKTCATEDVEVLLRQDQARNPHTLVINLSTRARLRTYRSHERARVQLFAWVGRT